MLRIIFRSCPALGIFIFMFYSLIIFAINNAYALLIHSDKIDAIAIYSSGLGHSMKEPNEIGFNIINRDDINTMISCIDFSVERDCSEVLAYPAFIIYIKFKDKTIEVYEIFARKRHLSKIGLRSSCYELFSDCDNLFNKYAQ